MQMEDYNARCQKARQATLVQLQEKLKQRMVAADEAEARDQKEQEVLKQEQMATMTRVLSTNMELSDEAKKRILREHEQNMQVLSNQLLRSKLRQRKSLEIKLNQRKTRLAELQKQQRELRSGKEDDSETKLAKELAKEEEAFEEARQEAVAELRRQLAKETEEALKLHDDEIGLLIGRLQVR
ncbi:trichohyalin-like [Plakobranchus ocellatus]|uniref:Trichohyalin-like n=1 Tax=Plakobranchus ocellatus TaxID=259542 RepID=A0AAV3Y479_9GAST|nr:trichohyalin-like [Plakobranchus ocellatus]